MENGDKEYKEIKIGKMIVNGKEQKGNIISSEDTKNKQELHVTIYTQDLDTVEKKREERSWIYELLKLKKGFFHNKRS